jgi:hypothetical protein
MRWIQITGIILSLSIMACDSRSTDPGEGSGAPATPLAQAAVDDRATVGIGPGFTAVNLLGRSGGTVNALHVGVGSNGEPCTGNIEEASNHRLRVTDTITATFAVMANADTTLVITGPGGPYCSDDFDGLNPGLHAMTLEAGIYDVYVGNFSLEEGPTQYTLAILPVIPEIPPAPEGSAEGTGGP